MNLSPSDLTMFERFHVPLELVERAEIVRVTHDEANHTYGINGYGDRAGLIFPYLDPLTGKRVTARLRRDSPELENGKPKNKYISAYGDKHHLYFVAGCRELVEDPAVPVVLVEAEKSALALTAFAERTRRRLLPVATGGCWSWRGRIGKVENAKGERVDEVGPLDDLIKIAQPGRVIYVMFDANAATNPKVSQARRGLVRVLRKQRSEVHVLNLPAVTGVNGPDDLLAVSGDEAMAKLFDDPQAARSTEWRKQLIQAKDESGEPRAVLENALTALRLAPEWEGVVGYNQFSLYVECLKPLPFERPGGGKNWTDRDDVLTCGWLQRQGIMVNSRVAAEAVQTVAEENPFHPVRDYLQSLTWDRKPRLNRWLSTYLGAPDSNWTGACGPRWLISAVARIMWPGCQVDHVLLIEGPQGNRKSTALRVLAGDEWFSDHISDLGSKDSRIELHGKWILEIAELDRVRHRELERVKAFLTARIDNFRLPYGRRSEAVPRSCVFAATVNDQTPLTDETGNRRFWPVRAGVIELEALEFDRDQLWAEAYQRFRGGETWWLDSTELNQLAHIEQEKRYEPGVWDDVILEWLKNPAQSSTREPTPKGDIEVPVSTFNSSPERVSITDILVHAIGKDLDRCTQVDRNQVARCLVHAGWTYRQDRSRGPDRGKRFFYRPDSDRERGEQDGNKSGNVM